MYAVGIRHHVIAPNASAEHTVAALIVNHCALDARGLSIPRAEPHVVARFGPKAMNGLDLHVMGARHRAHRKKLHRGQRVVMARLRLGTHQAVFGVPPSALAERIVPLEDLWGSAARRLAEQLAETKDVRLAATVLEAAIEQRLANVEANEAHTQLAVEATARLTALRVDEVADALGVSARNLRRVFRDVVGMSPKEYARLARFHLALQEARTSHDVDWAGVAAATGYYDQAHMIAEFHAIAGVTPRALMSELRAGLTIGSSDAWVE
ncbi:MAG: helix-turn-helix transcriptional regulator [Polyangiaceae bacterium]